MRPNTRNIARNRKEKQLRECDNMDCPCGHPIVWKKDIAIVDWKRQRFVLHTECFGKYFSVMNTGFCVPTRALLDIIEKKRIVEEKVEAPEVKEEPAPAPEPKKSDIAPEIKCPLCGGQAVYTVVHNCYVCLDCQSTTPRHEPKPEPSK